MYKESGLISAHGFEGFRPEQVGYFALGPYEAMHHGEKVEQNCLSRDQEIKTKHNQKKKRKKGPIISICTDPMT